MDMNQVMNFSIIFIEKWPTNANFFVEFFVDNDSFFLYECNTYDVYTIKSRRCVMYRSMKQIQCEILCK